MLCMRVGPNKVQLIYCFIITLCDYNYRTGRLGSRKWLLERLRIYLLSTEPYIIFEVHPDFYSVGAVGFLGIKVID
jgi:hypothetical protein